MRICDLRVKLETMIKSSIQESYSYLLIVLVLCMLVSSGVVTGAGFVQVAKLVPSDVEPGYTSTRCFGVSVSIHNNQAIIGALKCGNGMTGAAYIFSLFNGEIWEQKAKLMSDEVDLFGISVSISSGNQAIVGADYAGYYNNSGSAYIFSASDGVTWVQKAKLKGIDANCGFGRSVSMSYNLAIIGAFCDDYISGPTDSGPGSVYIFSSSDGATWMQKAKVVASDSAEYDNFGYSVSFGDNQILVGAYRDIPDGCSGQEGSAYIFSSTSSETWVQKAKLMMNSFSCSDDLFGHSVSMGYSQCIIGARNNGDGGSAFIFSPLDGVTWVQTAKISESNLGGEQFGISVSMSNNKAIIGANRDTHEGGFWAGSAYLYFSLDRSTWVQTAKIVPSDTSEALNFGTSVSIKWNQAVIGANGSAYIVLPECDAEPGFYCSEGELIESSCPAGFFCPGGDSLALECPAGFYCPLQSIEPTSCSLGSYCPTRSESEGNCPAGNFCPEGASNIILCTSGHFCPNVSMTAVGPSCKAGYFCPEGSVAMTPCTSGYYCDQEGMALPGPICEAGNFCPEGSTSMIPCNSGHVCPNTSMKAVGPSCEIGHFCPMGAATMIPCTGGHYCEEEGMDTVGYNCEPGSFCPQGSSAMTQCSSGHVCSNSSMAAVGPECDVGHFCPEGSVAMTPCTSGHYCEDEGMGSVGPLCEPGYFCPAGSVMPSPCKEGRFCPDSGMISVGPICPAGFYCPERSSRPQPCPLGYYCPEASFAPLPCQVGYYCPNGSVSMVTCPLNNYCDEVNLAQSKDCFDHCNEKGSMGCDASTGECVCNVLWYGLTCNEEQDITTSWIFGFLGLSLSIVIYGRARASKMHKKLFCCKVKKKKITMKGVVKNMRSPSMTRIMPFNSESPLRIEILRANQAPEQSHGEMKTGNKGLSLIEKAYGNLQTFTYKDSLLFLIILGLIIASDLCSIFGNVYLLSRSFSSFDSHDHLKAMQSVFDEFRRLLEDIGTEMFPLVWIAEIFEKCFNWFNQININFVFFDNVKVTCLGSTSAVILFGDMVVIVFFVAILKAKLIQHFNFTFKKTLLTKVKNQKISFLIHLVTEIWTRIVLYMVQVGLGLLAYKELFYPSYSEVCGGPDKFLGYVTFLITIICAPFWVLQLVDAFIPSKELDMPDGPIRTCVMIAHKAKVLLKMTLGIWDKGMQDDNVFEFVSFKSKVVCLTAQIHTMFWQLFPPCVVISKFAEYSNWGPLFFFQTEKEPLLSRILNAAIIASGIIEFICVVLIVFEPSKILVRAYVAFWLLVRLVKTVDTYQFYKSNEKDCKVKKRIMVKPIILQKGK
mmetsp:Transcript_6000/g.7569  ORF Transcript_6000/g.7569 Transcript_6000/m.7569 type:complete len:1324 (-) Transcript_6000:217-4188(-)